MPCAAPCDRLPCDERCAKILKCGHQCPSLCGEDCPKNLYQECGDKGDARVDLLEWKTYSEINLHQSSIIVLGCGHFFTSESVDGLVGLDEVYTRDKDGRFDSLRDVCSLVTAIPSCPDCKQPIRQFATKRYNRAINRAVMDGICKGFLTKGRTDLEVLESRLNDVEDKLKSTEAFLATGDAKSQLKARYTACEHLETEATSLSKTMEAENQPMQRLRDAITIYQKSARDKVASLSTRMEPMSLAPREPDNEISLGARLISINAPAVVLSDMFRVVHSSEKTAAIRRLRFTKPSSTLTPVLKQCRDLITQANGRSLSRIVIRATISFAKIAQMDAWYHRTHPVETTTNLHPQEEYTGFEKVEDRTKTTRDLLIVALKLCDELRNCPKLQEKSGK